MPNACRILPILFVPFKICPFYSTSPLLELKPAKFATSVNTLISIRDQAKINTCRRKAINTVTFRSPFLISPSWQISVRFGHRADRTASRRVLSAPYVLIVVVSARNENSGRRFSGRCYRRTTFAILDSPRNPCSLFPSIARHGFPVSTDRGKYVNLPRNVTLRRNHEHEALVRPYRREIYNYFVFDTAPFSIGKNCSFCEIAV